MEEKGSCSDQGWDGKSWARDVRERDFTSGIVYIGIWWIELGNGMGWAGLLRKMVDVCIRALRCQEGS